ncbi:MAG: diaminopimelate decarboxylase, partial [Planctomycetota bacterium]
SEAFGPEGALVCYSVKANGNLSVLRLLKDEGSGFDIVSGGELTRLRRVGADFSKVVYAGVGKTADEIRAAIRAGVLLFNVESEPELAALDALASGLGSRARAALRINPDLEAGGHAHISTGKHGHKFGLPLAEARAAAKAALGMRGVEIAGVHLHIGSQITETGPHAEAARIGAAFADELRNLGHPIRYLNLGGGFGIDYRGGEAKPVAEFAEAVRPAVKASGLRLILEPGRFLVGAAGVLLARVLYVKKSAGKRFVIVDAAMNDLIRPALYDAFHRILPSSLEPGLEGSPTAADAPAADWEPADIVGPVCETGDAFARDRMLPQVCAGDLVAIFCAGAYGFSMSSNYNARPRAAEVIVEDRETRLSRARETAEDLMRGEA